MNMLGVPKYTVIILLEVDGTPRARFSYSHFLMVCLVLQWNWH
jgi:hypothetical protein